MGNLLKINGWLAFTGGLISFFSPCVLPIIPAYIGILAGNDESQKRRKLLTNGLGFVLGFSIIFMLLGLTTTLLGQVLLTYKTIFQRVGGTIVLVFGLSMLGIINMNRFKLGQRNFIPLTMNFYSAILMGTVFAIGWTPCIGMVLATILILAGTTAPTTGIYLLFLYSLGFAIPFIAVAFIFQSLSHKLSPFLPTVQKLGGVVFILLGIAIFTDKLEYLSKLLL